MIGSSGIATVVALWGFWVLLFMGWVRDELGVRGSALFILLRIAGFVGFRYVLYGLLFAPYVAVLDIILVFVIVKGDVRLT